MSDEDILKTIADELRRFGDFDNIDYLIPQLGQAIDNILAKNKELKEESIPVALIKEKILKPMVEEHDRIIKNILEKDLPNRLEDGGVAQDLGYFIEKMEELLERRK